MKSAVAETRVPSFQIWLDHGYLGEGGPGPKELEGQLRYPPHLIILKEGKKKGEKDEGTKEKSGKNQQNVPSQIYTFCPPPQPDLEYVPE